MGGRAEYYLSGPDGNTWSGSWKFTAVTPIDYFAANDGEDNAEDANMPAGMTFTFATTPTEVMEDVRFVMKQGTVYRQE